MSKDYKFEGWMGHDKDSVNGKLVWEEFEPKPWEETDVDIQITHCGICATDLHTLRSGHGQVSQTKSLIFKHCTDFVVPDAIP